MTLLLTNKELPHCPACNATYVIRKGKRRNRLRTTPLFQCNECGHRFIGEAGKHKTYPLKTILEAISTFNLGHSLNETQSILRRRGHVDIPDRTIRSWISQYRPLTTYARLRSAARTHFGPTAIFKVFVIDEAWRFLRHPTIRLYILEALKTWREKVVNAGTLENPSATIPGMQRIDAWVRPFFEPLGEVRTLEMADGRTVRFYFKDFQGSITVASGIEPPVSVLK
jgi:transposase-like protein